MIDFKVPFADVLVLPWVLIEDELGQIDAFVDDEVVMAVAFVHVTTDAVAVREVTGGHALFLLCD